MKNLNKTSGIFLLYEGLPPTIIESQVLVHVRAMCSAGLPMEVWAFAVTPRAYLTALNSLPRLLREYKVTIRVFRGVKPALPFSEWMNALLLAWWMWRLGARPPFVHARTEHAAAIAAIIRKLMGYRLIWDARGDALSEFKEKANRMPRIARWLAPIKERAIARRLKIATRHCDFAIFVSNALRDLQGRSLPTERTLVIPCLADESLFFYSPDLRADARRELGYGGDDVVIVYVGSTALWQCIPETVSLMAQALRTCQDAKALIITSNKGAFESLFDVDLRDRIRITSGTLKEMNRYLNAADIGVLLRTPNAINRVASPVKFAEYSLAGLTVVTTDAVEQVTEYGRLFENVVSANDLICSSVTIWPMLTNRAEIAKKAKVALGRSNYEQMYLRQVVYGN